MDRRLLTRLAVMALAAAAFVAFQEWGGPAPDRAAEPPATAPQDPGAGGDEARLVEAFDAGRSGVVLEVAGRVEKVLPDDDHGSRHQRFVLRLASGHTVLVSHNIDLAPRVEALARGDRVALRGQYEWNEKGGVVHWTHRDPDGRRPGGWIRHAGALYR